MDRLAWNYIASGHYTVKSSIGWQGERVRCLILGVLATVLLMSGGVVYEDGMFQRKPRIFFGGYLL